MTGSHVLFHRQERMAGKGTRSDENERHAHTLTRTVRQRSLHGPIQLNVSVSRSVAISVSVHMESRAMNFYCLDFFFYRVRIHICIRTNTITPLDIVCKIHLINNGVFNHVFIAVMQHCTKWQHLWLWRRITCMLKQFGDSYSVTG